MAGSREERRERMNPAGTEEEIRRPRRPVRDHKDDYREDDESDPNEDSDDEGAEDGDEEEDTEPAQKSVSTRRRPPETRTTMTELGETIFDGFFKALAPTQELIVALQGQIIGFREELVEMRKSVDDMADQGEEIAGRFVTIEKGLAIVDAQAEMVKGLVEAKEKRIDESPAPRSPVAAPIKNSELLVKGLDARNEAPGPSEAVSEVVQIMRRGQAILAEHYIVPAGLEEFTDAYNTGNLTNELVDSLKKGIEVAEGELGLSKNL